MATLISRRTGNLRAVQLPLGRTKIESTVRYLGIEVDDALAIAEQVDGELLGQSRNAPPVPLRRIAPLAELRINAEHIQVLEGA